MSNTLDEILERVYLYGMNGGLGYGKFENELSPKEAKQQIQTLITEARIDERSKLQEVVNYMANAKMDATKYGPSIGLTPKENK